MKEKIWAQIEDHVAAAVAQLTVEIIHTGVVIASEKLKAYREQFQTEEEQEEDSDEEPVKRLFEVNHRPLHMDELITLSGSTIGEVNASLLQLELDGYLKRLPGGMFAKAA